MKWGNLKVWTAILLLVGILIRLQPYCYNRALEHDEAFLSNNIIQKNFSELTSFLDHAQVAPILFLWVEKIAINLLGVNEFALRLVPLICGILSIFLFYKLANKIFDGTYLLLAMGFFIFCSEHIHYTNDVKQYSGDVFCSIVILLLSMKLFDSKISNKSFLQYGIGGGICVWFSQPSIFVLAGGFVALFVHYWRTDQKEQIKKLDLAGLTWGASFLIYYYFFLRHSITIDHFQNFHQPYRMPLKFWEIESLQWYANSFFNVLNNPVGIHFKYLGGIVFLFGIYRGLKTFGKHSIENKNILLLLLLPVIFAFGASALEKYTTLPRLLLFTAPMLILILVNGLQQLNHVFIRFVKHKNAAIIAPVLGGVLMLQSFLNTIHRTAAPKQIEEIKAPIEFMAQNKQPGDVVYIYQSATAQFDFYKNKFDTKGLEEVIGENSYKDWKNHIINLKNKKRVWFLFSHYKRADGVNDKDTYRQFLNTIGKELMHLDAYGSSVYLYDLER